MALPEHLITGKTAKLPGVPGDLKKQPVPKKMVPRKVKARARVKRDEHLARFLATPPAPVWSDEQRQAQRVLFERHDPAVVEIRLPLAPSVNHYWSSFVPKGRSRALTYISNEGQAYQEAVANFWWLRMSREGRLPAPMTGRLRLLVVIHMARNGDTDLDNRIKPLQDALCKAGVFGDDSQVDDLRAIRGHVIPGTGAMDVILEVIPDLSSADVREQVKELFR